MTNLEAIKKMASSAAFRGCSFDDAGITAPLDLGNGNVVFPRSMDHRARREWRSLMDMPGYETDNPA